MIRCLLTIALFSAVPLARADDRQVAHGRELVEANCSGCHAVASSDRSPHADAPAFRDLSQRYPIEELAEALAEGVSTGHPDMPEFVASPTQVEAILAYLRSLQP